MSSLYRYHNAQAVEAAKTERDSDAWHKQRGETIGASEIAQAIGVSPYGGLLSLVQKKRDLRAGIVDRFDNDAMADGRDAEDTILRMAARRLRAGVADNGPLQMMPGVIVVDGPISATPDGVLVDDHNVVAAVVEAKLDRGRNDWQHVADYGFGDLSPGDVRLAYWWQVQQQLRVTGCATGYLAVWTVYQFHLIEIAADAVAHAAIDEAAEATSATPKLSKRPKLLPSRADSRTRDKRCRTRKSEQSSTSRARIRTGKNSRSRSRPPRRPLDPGRRDKNPSVDDSVVIVSVIKLEDGQIP